MNEFKCNVFWMDSGNLLVSKLTKLKFVLHTHGFLSNFSQGVVKDWTFFKTLEYLNVSKEIYEKRNLSGGCVGFSYYHNTSMQLLDKWFKCALKKECIAPKGSNRNNHRQDQAVLTVLAYQLNLVQKLEQHVNLEKFLGYKIHQDVD